MGKVNVEFNEMELAKIESTVREDVEGDQDVYKATFKADRKDGSKVSVIVQINQPADKGGRKKLPFAGLLVGQKHDVEIGNKHQTTLKMP